MSQHVDPAALNSKIPFADCEYGYTYVDYSLTIPFSRAHSTPPIVVLCEIAQPINNSGRVTHVYEKTNTSFSVAVRNSKADESLTADVMWLAIW